MLRSLTILLVTLQDLRGLTPFEVGLALTVGSLGWTAGSWLQSQSWLRLDRNAFVTLGATVTRSPALLGLAAAR